MVQRLSDPDDVDGVRPILEYVDEIPVLELDRTGKRAKRLDRKSVV